MKYPIVKNLCQILVWILLCGNAAAQSGSGTAGFTSNVLTENFDGFSSTGCPCNTMPAGWYVYDNVDSRYTTGTGISATGDLLLLGPSTDKAFGSIYTGTLRPVWGVNVTNNTGSTITSVKIQFTGESWRVVQRAVADRLDFQYNIGGGTITDAATATGWVDVDALDYRPFVVGATGLARSGAASSVQLMDYTISGLSIPDNSTVFFRWLDADVAGSDDAAAIDDLTITANPSCDAGITYISQDFEVPIPATGCWSPASTTMGVSSANAIYNGGSGRTINTAAVSGASSDQLKANITQTGLFSDLSSPAPTTITWEFTVRTDLAGQFISTSNLWGYFLFTNQSNLIATTKNTGYAVGVNIASSADRTIKLYKFSGQRWDSANTALITSNYVYPSASPATSISDANVTVKVVRTGNNASATWDMYLNNVKQTTYIDNTPVLPVNTATPSFTSGFFNQHNASRAFVIDDIIVYNGQRPCNSSSSACRNATVLPLKLISFKGAPADNMAMLDWQISDAADTRIMEIERSFDGTNYEKIGTMPVSTSQSQYHLAAPQNVGTAYYRLKMTDYDGFVSYSGVVQITGNKNSKNTLLISPNLVYDDANIIFSKSETGMLQVTNHMGQLILKQKVNNQHQARLPTRSLAKGFYTVTFNGSSGSVLTGRFVKH